MLKIFGRPHPKISSVFLVLLVLEVAGCDSPEDRAKNYYEHGLKLLSEHDSTKAALELQKCRQASNGTQIGAWKTLAEIDETTARNWAGLVADMRAIVELTPSDVSTRLKLGKLHCCSPKLVGRGPQD